MEKEYTAHLSGAVGVCVGGADAANFYKTTGTVALFWDTLGLLTYSEASHIASVATT